jgi:hypothetical protein
VLFGVSFFSPLPRAVWFTKGNFHYFVVMLILDLPSPSSTSNGGLTAELTRHDERTSLNSTGSVPIAALLAAFFHP